MTMPTMLLRKDAVLKRTALSNSSLYQLIREERFPPPHKVGKASFWDENEVAMWIESVLNDQQSKQKEVV
jgi:predicted DNA-binding transcriptional regulator AlpA